MTSEWTSIELGVWEFPGSLVIGIQCFHCWGTRSNTWLGNKIPQAAQQTQKKKKKNRHLDVSIT